MFRLLICTVHLTVSSCLVTYAFQSESTLCSCLNVKELLARSRRKIWRLSDCNWTRTQSHLVQKRTLNHLTKLAWTHWFWFRVQLQSLKFQISRLLRARSSLTCQEHIPWHVKNIQARSTFFWESVSWASSSFPTFLAEPSYVDIMLHEWWQQEKSKLNPFYCWKGVVVLFVFFESSMFRD